MIGASCQNPFQPFQPKIRTEHFLHFLQQLQQVCFACMWQFKMFSRNNPFPHFCHFPNISFTAGDTGCVFLQSRVVRAHVCTCLHNIFQHRQNKQVVQTCAPCAASRIARVACTPSCNWVSNWQLLRVKCFLQKKGEQRVQFGESSTNARNIFCAVKLNSTVPLKIL